MVAYQEICKEFGVEIGESTVNSTAVNGEKYIDLTSGGIKEQGSMFNVLCLNSERAWELYEEVLRKYLNGKKIVYWRSPPRITTIKLRMGLNGWDERETIYYSVSSRLVGE